MSVALGSTRSDSPPTALAAAGECRCARRWVGIGAGALLGASCLIFTGCGKPLFSPTDERSPFDRFDAVRNQHAPQYVEDEYGRQTPNLRARLAPKR